MSLNFDKLYELQDKKAPLYFKYKECVQCQPAYLMMDESGTVWADRDITVDVNRSAVPGAIAAGHTLRWELSSHLSGRDIAALPKDQKIVELLTGIHEGHTLVFNEQNKQVGQLTKEAKKAVVELGRYLDIVHTPLCTHGAEASSRAS